MVVFEAALPPEVELEILQLHYPCDGEEEQEITKLLGLVRKLRDGELETYTPAVRDLVNLATLLDIGIGHREAFAQAIAHKYSAEEQIAAWTAYEAAFESAPEPESEGDEAQ